MRLNVAVAIALGALVSGGVLVWSAYHREMRGARRRSSWGSDVVQTACGPIEIATAGEGPAILVSHGAGGGFDQGLDIGAPFVEAGFRIIAPSRFGYLRSPLTPDATPQAQADAYDCLLDQMKVERAMVIGISAGAPSAMQFAIRHPERTSALVLIVPAAYPPRVVSRSAGALPPRMSRFALALFDAAVRSDFLYWMVEKLSPSTMAKVVLGTPPADIEQASPAERDRAFTVAQRVLPVSSRTEGLRNDAAITPSLLRYDLEKITAPTLIIGVENCLYGTWDGARYSAEHITGARFVGFPTGGHLWLGHQEEVTAAVEAFLRDVVRP